MSNLPISNPAMKEYEEFPSGKVIIRQFDDGGCLVREQQTYGMLDIGISYEFRAGTKCRGIGVGALGSHLNL